MKNKKIIGVLLGLGLSLFAVFSVQAQEPGQVGEGSMQLDPKAGIEGINQLFKSVPPPNPFNPTNAPVEAVKDLAFITSFQSSPLTSYQLDFPPDSPKVFRKGEKINLSASLSYSQKEKDIKNTLDKAKENCLGQIKGLKDKTEEEKTQMCAGPEIYRFPTLTGVGVFTQVWRKDESASRTKYGDYLIDEFYLAQGLTLENTKDQKINLAWQVPQFLPKGSYYFSFFVTGNKRFPLSGFPVNVVAPALIYGFDVTTDGDSGIALDKDNVKINSTAYSQALPVPTVQPQNGKVNLELPVINLDNTTQSVKVRFELNRWTQEDPANVLIQEDQTIELTPKGKATVNFDFTPNKIDSVYTVRVIAATAGSKSSIDVHLILKDQNRGIFLFLSQALGKDGKSYPVFCPRDAQWVGQFPGKVKLTLLDKKAKELGFWEKQGIIEPVDGRCFAVRDPKFNDLSKNQCLTLKGEIFSNDGELTDETAVPFGNCAQLASPDQLAQPAQLAQPVKPVSPAKLLLLPLIIILILLGGIIIYLKRKKHV